MGSVNLVVVVESVRTIASKTGNEPLAFHLPSIIAVGAALGILLFYCPLTSL
jgi:hypothetical protein